MEKIIKQISKRRLKKDGLEKDGLEKNRLRINIHNTKIREENE